MTRTEVFVPVSGAARVRLGEDPEKDLHVGDCLVVPAGTVFELGNPTGGPFEAVVCMPVGGQAAMSGAQPFTPAWTI